MPLMHPAHALRPQQVALGAGFSGQFAVDTTVDEADPVVEQVLEEGALSPGLAPWAAGRMGLDYDFEAGLTYSGRTLRLDARRAFDFGAPALSIGLGASAVLPKRRDEFAFRVSGAGGDLPLLFGLCSSSDVICAWIGGRGGFEILEGQRDLDIDPAAPLDTAVAEEISAWHAYAGGLVGLRVGFRYVFAVLELDGAMHWAGGEVGLASGSLRQFGLSPAGAIVGRF